MAKLLLLFCIALFITEFVNTDTIGYYAIPEPEIIAFERGGLRVILKDISGISVFRFHANVNENMKQLYPGTINLEASSKINGKWILEDRNVRLRVGDVIYYWLFVEKDRLGYVKQPVEFKIKELVPFYNEDKGNEIPITYHTSTTTLSLPTAGTTTEITPTTPRYCPPSQPCPNTISLSTLQNQIDTLNRKIELVTSITSLQGQVDAIAKKFDSIDSSSVLKNEIRNISNTVQLIMMTLESLPDAKRLTLSGVLPIDQDSNADQVVRFVIWEKLDLRVNIVTAVRNKDGTIVFELKTLQEKFDVLNAAKEKLKNTRIVIS